MQDQLFEYAVIRIMPRVEREEFMNVGIIVYCSKQKFLQILYQVTPNRLEAFCAGTDLQEVQKNLEAMDNICKGISGSGPIGKLDIASRFRWLTATRSTVIQTSKVHPGFCINPSEVILKLYKQLIL